MNLQVSEASPGEAIFDLTSVNLLKTQKQHFKNTQKHKLNLFCYATILPFSGETEIQGTEKLRKEEILDAKIAKFLSVRSQRRKKHQQQQQPLLHFTFYTKL